MAASDSLSPAQFPGPFKVQATFNLRGKSRRAKPVEHPSQDAARQHARNLTRMKDIERVTVSLSDEGHSTTWYPDIGWGPVRDQAFRDQEKANLYKYGDARGPGPH